MKTKTIGEILREEREKHGLSIQALARKTRIRVQYLQALEQNEFLQLPAAAFVKGYIKTYAQLFGFDYQPLIALLRRDFKESAKGQLVPREFIKPVLKKRQFWRPATAIVITLAVVFLSLVGYIGVQWYNLNRPPELELTAPSEEQLVAPRVQVRGTTEPDAVVTVNEQPVSLQPDGSFQTEIYITREGMSTISVEAIDRRGKSTLEQRTVQVKF